MGMLRWRGMQRRVRLRTRRGTVGGVSTSERTEGKVTEGADKAARETARRERRGRSR